MRGWIIEADLYRLNKRLADDNCPEPERDLLSLIVRKKRAALVKMQIESSMLTVEEALPETEPSTSWQSLRLS